MAFHSSRERNLFRGASGATDSCPPPPPPISEKRNLDQRRGEGALSASTRAPAALPSGTESERRGNKWTKSEVDERAEETRRTDALSSKRGR